MKPALVLLSLVAVSASAGAWLMWPQPQGDSASEPCGRSAACEGSPQPPAEAVAPQPEAAVQEQSAPVAVTGEPDSPAAAPAPGAADYPASRSPAVVADGATLRAQADRLIAEGRVREGIDTLRKATEVDPSARNHGDLGALLQRLTAMDEAVRHLRRAAELDPGNADRWIELANAYYRSVNPGEAWKAERRARRAEPGLVLGRDASGMRIRRSDSVGRAK